MANGFIKYLRRKNGDVILPKTSTKAVIDGKGDDLETVLSTFQKLINTVSNNVVAAQETADKGVIDASNAQITANRGVSDAANAQNTANEAITKAANAQNTANEAVTKADNAQVTADNAMPKANFVFDPETGTLDITL